MSKKGYSPEQIKKGVKRSQRCAKRHPFGMETGEGRALPGNAKMIDLINCEHCNPCSYLKSSIRHIVRLYMSTIVRA